MKNKIDVNAPDGQKLLKQYVQSLVRLDKQIKTIKEEKVDILKRASDEGFDRGMISKTISAIRKEQNTSEVKATEEEVYYTIIKESGLVE